MKNFLFSLLGLHIYLYGIGVVLALIFFLFSFWRLIRKTSYSEEKLVDALFSAAMTGLVAGRGVYVYTHPDIFKGSVLKPFILLAYPGVNELFFWMGFFVFWLFYASRRKYTFNSLFKLLAGPIVLAKLILALFSFLKEWHLPSLYQFSAYIILIFIFFLVVRIRKWKNWEIGYRTLAIYLALPPFIIDFFDNQRVYFLGQKVLSVNQLGFLSILILAVLTSLISLVKKKK